MDTLDDKEYESGTIQTTLEPEEETELISSYILTLGKPYFHNMPKTQLLKIAAELNSLPDTNYLQQDIKRFATRCFNEYFNEVMRLSKA